MLFHFCGLQDSYPILSSLKDELKSSIIAMRKALNGNSTNEFNEALASFGVVAQKMRGTLEQGKRTKGRRLWGAFKKVGRAIGNAVNSGKNIVTDAANRIDSTVNTVMNGEAIKEVIDGVGVVKTAATTFARDAATIAYTISILDLWLSAGYVHDWSLVNWNFDIWNREPSNDGPTLLLGTLVRCEDCYAYLGANFKFEMVLNWWELDSVECECWCCSARFSPAALLSSEIAPCTQHYLEDSRSVHSLF